MSNYTAKFYVLVAVGSLILTQFRSMMQSTYPGFFPALIENILLTALFLVGLWVWDQLGYSKGSDVKKHSYS